MERKKCEKMKANMKKTKAQAKVMATAAPAVEKKMNMHIKHYTAREIIIFILINCFGISGCAKQITFSWNRAISYYEQMNSQPLLFLIKYTHKNGAKKERENGFAKWAYLCDATAMRLMFNLHSRAK